MNNGLLSRHDAPVNDAPSAYAPGAGVDRRGLHRRSRQRTRDLIPPRSAQRITAGVQNVATVTTRRLISTKRHPKGSIRNRFTDAPSRGQVEESPPGAILFALPRGRSRRRDRDCVADAGGSLGGRCHARTEPRFRANAAGRRTEPESCERELLRARNSAEPSPVRAEVLASRTPAALEPVFAEVTR